MRVSQTGIAEEIRAHLAQAHIWWLIWRVAIALAMSISRISVSAEMRLLLILMMAAAIMCCCRDLASLAHADAIIRGMWVEQWMEHIWECQYLVECCDR